MRKASLMDVHILDMLVLRDMDNPRYYVQMTDSELFESGWNQGFAYTQAEAGLMALSFVQFYNNEFFPPPPEDLFRKRHMPKVFEVQNQLENDITKTHLELQAWSKINALLNT